MRIEQAAIVMIVVLLLSIGLIMIYNSSTVWTSETARYMNDSLYFLKRQLAWLLVGIAVFLVVANIPYSFFLKHSWLFVCAAFALLLLVFVPGIGEGSVYGSRRRLDLGPVAFQPAELAQYALIFYLARYLSLKQRKLKNFTKGMLPPLLVSAAFIGLIFLQPKLGTALALLMLTVVMLYAGGCRVSHLLLVGAALVAVVSLGIALLFVPMPYQTLENYQEKAKNKLKYQWDRVDALVNMEDHKNDIAYQQYQSLIAVGSGGVKGVGLAQGKQKYGYLPLIYNDFMGSIIGEELGFLGLLSIILAYAGIAFCGFRIALQCKQIGGYLAAVGITSLISLYAFIHLGVICGLLPVTGLNLPFISYGGSNLVMNFFGVATLLSISRGDRRLRKSKIQGVRYRKTRP